MAVILVLSSVAYVLLRSPIWIGDGIRWLNTVVAPTFPAEGGGNRHFLFPYLAWSVFHAAAALPFLVDTSSNDVTRAGVIAIVQGWNALMAGASLALLYAWLRCSASRPASALGVAITAMSHAFLLHATNMTEPMTSMPLALLALVLVTRFADEPWARWTAGVLIGLAGTFYVIAGFSVVAVAVIVGLRNPRSERKGAARAVMRAAEVGAASAVTFCAIYSIPQLLAHPHGNMEGTVAGAISPDLMGMYGRLELRHMIGAVAGLGNAFWALPSLAGLSQLFHQSPWAIVRSVATMIVAMTFVVSVSWITYRGRSELSANHGWAQAVGSIAWFITVYFIAGYFLPSYEKIWLFAMPPLSLLAALAFDVRQRKDGLRPALLTAGTGLLLVFLNLTFVALPRRFAHNYDLDAALRLSSLVQPNDLVVVHGWDGPSVYATMALSRPLTCVRLTDEALRARLQADEISRRLAADVEHARSEGGRIYFLGLLEQSAEQWQSFFGSQMHLPYALLEPYRRTARVRATIEGAVVTETLFEVVDSPP
jgi:hypothetical protein